MKIATQPNNRNLMAEVPKYNAALLAPRRRYHDAVANLQGVRNAQWRTARAGATQAAAAALQLAEQAEREALDEYRRVLMMVVESGQLGRE